MKYEPRMVVKDHGDASSERHVVHTETSLEKLIQSRTKYKWPFRINYYKKSQKDLYAWCEKFCKGDYLIGDLCARFTSEDDAILFKLKWGGS